METIKTISEYAGIILALYFFLFSLGIFKEGISNLINGKEDKNMTNYIFENFKDIDFKANENTVETLTKAVNSILDLYDGLLSTGLSKEDAKETINRLIAVAGKLGGQ